MGDLWQKLIAKLESYLYSILPIIVLSNLRLLLSTMVEIYKAS